MYNFHKSSSHNLEQSNKYAGIIFVWKNLADDRPEIFSIHIFKENYIANFIFFHDSLPKALISSLYFLKYDFIQRKAMHWASILQNKYPKLKGYTKSRRHKRIFSPKWSNEMEILRTWSIIKNLFCTWFYLPVILSKCNILNY